MAHRHQHVVPRLLLRHFAVDDEVEVRSRTRATRVLNISNVAVLKHFYSYETGSTKYDTSLERYLDDRVESGAGAAILRLLDGSIDDADFEAAGRFAVVQLARSPRFGELDELAEQAIGPLLAGMDAVSAYRAARSAEDWDDDDAREIFLAARRDPPPEYRVRSDRNSRIRVLIRTVDRLLERAKELTWSVAEARRPALCLSDSPAVLFHANMPAGGFGGFDIGPEDELRLPLSPRHLLLGVRRHFGPTRFPAPRDLVVTTNELLARECRDALFVMPGTEPLGETSLALTSPRLPEPTITLGRSKGRASAPSFRNIIDEELGEILEGTQRPA